MRRFEKSILLDWEEPFGHIEVVGYSQYREVWNQDKDYWECVCSLPGMCVAVRNMEKELVRMGAPFNIDNHAGPILHEGDREILYLVHDGTVILYQHKF